MEHVESSIKILFVDDEDKIRTLLRLSIPWEELGYEIVGEASCGGQALELLPLLNPDVVITDIEMPVLNGLDFAEIMMHEYPHLKVIVLTAHDLFGYAKKGVDLGISAFILKPIRRRELWQTMEQLRDSIYEERRELYEVESLKARLKENRELIVHNFLNSMLLTPIPSKKLQENLQYYEIDLDTKQNYFNLCLFHPRSPDEESSILATMQCEKLMFSLLARVQGLFIFTDFNQNIVLLTQNHGINLYTYGTYIASFIKDKLGIELLWSMGKEVKKLEDIRHSYRHAFQHMKATTVIGNTGMISSPNYDKSRGELQDILQEVLDELPILLQLSSSEQISMMIQEAYRKIESIPNLPFSEILIASMTIVNTLLSVLRENGIPYDEIYQTDHLPYVHILGLKQAQEISQYLIQLITFTVHQMEQYTHLKSNQMIHSILQYMNENLSDSTLSLKKVSELHYANPSYISRVFKEVSGMNFSDYLNSIRINKAKKLLSETNLKIYEISEKVGVSDANYFSKFFKKHTDYTPAQYKEQKNQWNHERYKKGDLL